MTSEKPTLLLVDDSRFVRETAKRVLASRFRIRLAVDGRDAWLKIQQYHDIQVVFSDLFMPEMDGFELLKRIRDNHNERIVNLPVVVMTGAEDGDAAWEKAKGAGANDLVTKPFKASELMVRASLHCHYQHKLQQMKRLVTKDSATGLGNARFLIGRLRQELAFAQRHGHQLTVLGLNLKDVDSLFAQLGRRLTNRLLHQVGKIVIAKARKEDSLARIDTGRFVFVLPCADRAGARLFAERLEECLSQLTFNSQGKTIRLSVRLGLTTQEPHPGQTPRSVLDELATIMNIVDKREGNPILDDQKLRQEDSRLLPSPPERPPMDEPIAASVDMNVDYALRALARGNSLAVRQAAPQLTRQLKPLLTLLREVKEQSA